MSAPSGQSQSQSQSQGMDIDSQGDPLVTKIQQLMRQGLNNDSIIPKPNQIESIRGILQGQNVMYLDRTGAGKSDVYFVLTRMNRPKGVPAKCGPVVVIEPIKSLITDQLSRAIEFGLSAHKYNTDLSTVDRDKVVKQLYKNEVDILFLTPEMIAAFQATTHPIL